MAIDSRRLPGVFFEAPTPPPEETLPRMDIAAFVGFAESGPLHTPVAVESPREYRDVFGGDAPLAWDDERGELRRAHLGGAVEAFFSNGGLRCWVVRVADRSTAVNHVFALPGLIAAADREVSPIPSVEARARAAGSWCEPLSASTVLSGDPMPLVADAGPEAFAILVSSPLETTHRYQLDLGVPRATLQPGDLLEVSIGPGEPVLLLFVDRVRSIRGGVRVEGGEVDLATGEAAGAFWILPPPIGSPLSADADDPETVPPTPLSEADGILAAQAALTGSPPARPSVRRLAFDILVWRGAELQRSLRGLAFGGLHARFWAALPTDDELFALGAGASTPEPPVGLAREAASPRFALAGPALPSRALHYLPWGMSRRRRAQLAVGLPAPGPESSALERDGLARFSTGLFVDEHLAPVGLGALLGEAEYRRHVADLPLNGLHGLLPIEEASLISVPDAVHRGWNRELPPPEEPLPLGAPELDPIPTPDPAGRYRLRWTAVEGAGGYTLERDREATFSGPIVAAETVVDPEDDGDPLAAAVSLPPDCPRDVFFRVRAFRDGEIGPWSNTRSARLPAGDFAVCDDGRPAALVLDFAGGSPAPALTWIAEEPTEPLPDESEIEEATDAGFSAAAIFAPDGMTPGVAPLPTRRFAPRYYRIRGLRDGTRGVWSNTVRVEATERAVFTEPAARQYDPGVLVGVHRALLRFAAARGDLLAVLSLPAHYRMPDALEHTGQLTPGGPEADPAPPLPAPFSPRVPPLTEGEAAVLSYGALYHPWIATRASQSANGPLRRVPPEGALAGLMAAMALSEGAWRAPANRPLIGVLALDPVLDPASWTSLVGGQVNAILNDARGFLTRSEDTLGGEQALNRVHVRRLMILLRRLALREGQRWVFEPHGIQLRRRVRFLFEQLLGGLFQRGAFAGRDPAEAFRVVTDDTVNPPSMVERGRLLVELRVAPAAALQFLTVRLLTAGAGRLAAEEA